MQQCDLLDPPVFIDLETRSACDLPKAGGWNYAAHPSTHIMTVSWSDAPDSYHIWYPWHPTIREDYTEAQEVDAESHYGPEIPEALRAVVGRRWCAHNAWNFDQLVWSEKMPEEMQPLDWIDTEPLARAIGLPGGLDAIGKRLWGEGKYAVAKTVLKKHMHGLVYGDAADVPTGVMPMLGKYNLQDVVLMRGVWDEVVRWLKFPQEEWDVLAMHRGINHRGAPIDQDLLVSLIDLTDEGKSEAVKTIAGLTAGGKVELKTINDLQSRPKMFAWLDSIGITRFGNAKKGSLRRELVAQFIDAYQHEDGGDDSAPSELGDEDDDLTVDEAREQSRSIALAVRVLQLRSAALRITGGKLAAAAAAICADGRVRGLFVYAGAHTFRFAGRRIQVQNLPRPKDGIAAEQLKDGSWRFPIWEMIDKHERRDPKSGRNALGYKAVDALLPDRGNSRFRHLTPDDAASALIRMMIVSGETDYDREGKPIDWRDAEDPMGVLAADLSGIEARVLGHFAGEQGLMKTLWDGADLYIPMAEVMFGPWQSWPGVDPTSYKTAKKHPYRQAGKIVRLGAGYQLGGPGMDIYAMAQGFDLSAQGTSGPEAVYAYRKLHPAIAGEAVWKKWWDSTKKDYVEREVFQGGLWNNLSNAAKAAVRGEGPATVGVGFRVTFDKEGPHLMCYLPSGRRLIYRNARINPNGVPPFLRGTGRTTEVLEYLSPRYGWVHMYGGKWAENTVQAIARDFMTYGMLMVEQSGLPIIIHVHDEGVGVGRHSQKNQFMGAFTTLPPWASNFPLDAEGGWLPRYSKSPPPGDRYKEEVWRNGNFYKMA